MSDVEYLAVTVVQDMPGAPLEERMREAMRRNRGTMNPGLVREALIRADASTTHQHAGQ